MDSGPLAEDVTWDALEEETLTPELSLTSRDEMLLEDDSLLPEDVSSLLSDWQEELAIADDGTRPIPSAAEQEAMMASWRNMVKAKEGELRRERRRNLDDRSWAPAHLTGWLLEDGPGVIDDEEADDAPAAEARDAVAEAEAEDADSADESWTAAWQMYGERQREESSRKAARAALAGRVGINADLTSPKALGSWLLGQAGLATGATAEPAVGIDLGTTNCAVAAIAPGGRPFIIPRRRRLPSLFIDRLLRRRLHAQRHRCRVESRHVESGQATSSQVSPPHAQQHRRAGPDGRCRPEPVGDEPPLDVRLH